MYINPDRAFQTFKDNTLPTLQDEREEKGAAGSKMEDQLL